ncbi:MAG: hypothetical protein H6739_06550 [Alphaproteobacteria bacterium]|nr:hypothetical protein [Alphaproteobacteria bacterium]
MCTFDDSPESLAVQELSSHAVSLHVLGDSLDAAFETNARAAAVFREQWCRGDHADPRPVLDAHARMCALIDHAQALATSQKRDLDELTLALGTKPRA